MIFLSIATSSSNVFKWMTRKLYTYSTLDLNRFRQHLWLWLLENREHLRFFPNMFLRESRDQRHSESLFEYNDFYLIASKNLTSIRYAFYNVQLNLHTRR